MTNPAVTLHILNKPPGHARFADCLDALGKEDVLLLIENGVLALADNQALLPASTLALKSDCEARGIDHGACGVEFSGMVELTVRFPRIISW